MGPQDAVLKEEWAEISVPVPWGFVRGKSWNGPRGIPVVLIHGFFDNAGSFDTLVPLLPKGFFYVAIDLPDHGKSSHSPPGFPIKTIDYVYAVDHVADHFGWDTFTLLGHSFGGYVSYLYSAFFPERVNKLITIEAPFFMYNLRNSVQAILSVYRKQKEAETAKSSVYSYEEAVKSLMKTGYFELRTENNARNLAKRCLIKTEGGYKFSVDERLKVGNCQRISVEQSQMILNEIRCPTLQIVANGTMKVPGGLWRHLDIMRGFFKKNLGAAYFCRIVEGSHNVHADFPERVTGLVTDFLVSAKCNL